MLKIPAALTLVFGLLVSGAALGHGVKKHDGAVVLRMAVKEFGRTGDPTNVTRTVELKMNDEMQFVPNKITVTRGETIRFVVRNHGEILHEIVFGTESQLLKHSALMEKFPEMEHSEPYMTHVAPTKQGEIYWTFDQPGLFHFGCLIPGHFQAGMRGTVQVLDTGFGPWITTVHRSVPTDAS